MTPAHESDAILIERIRAGEADSWRVLIERYEGRLLAFVGSRLRDRAAGEDVVQETFVGLLASLPNFDAARSLETWLFSIAAHKLTDHLRREGRRPALPLAGGSAGESEIDVAAKDRAASSLVRSRERKRLEESALAPAMAAMLERWRNDGQWEKIQCAELLFVRGLPNKEVAAAVGLSEQQVANRKFEFLARLRTAVRQQGLSDEVFPELADA